MSHVLLFLAIKSHFLFVVLSDDTRVSVMLMKGEQMESKSEDKAGSYMFSAGNQKAGRTLCTRISIVFS